MFKVRASEAGLIMTDPRSKKDKESGVLSETVKTYAEKWHLGHKYGRKDVVVTDQMRKGIECEEQSITLLTNVTGKLYKKNKEHLVSSHFTGTPDIVTDGVVTDIKTAWDFWTFHKAEGPLTKTGSYTLYGWQLQVYMALTGTKKATLAYCLVNTPGKFVEGYLVRASYKFTGIDPDEDPEFKEYETAFRKNHVFDDIPEKERVKLWEVDYDKGAIDRLQERVEQVRNYIKTL